jgi:hypothetical protein
MVNTFLPDENFYVSATILDYKRLGKQRVEAIQILKANLGYTVGWVNHPAAKMWKGYETALCMYGLEMCYEWKNRGYKDTCKDKFMDFLTEALKLSNGEVIYPDWIKNQDVIDSHRSNLLRKDPEYYGKFGWDVEDNLPYLWPTDLKQQPALVIERSIIKEIG